MPLLFGLTWTVPIVNLVPNILAYNLDFFEYYPQVYYIHLKNNLILSNLM